MKILRWVIVVWFIFTGNLAFCATQTINPVPGSSATFMADLQTFLRSEMPDRNSSGIGNRVVFGGIGSTSASLSHTISAVKAFVEGYYVYDDSISHTYTASRDTFVLLRYNDATTFTIPFATITYDGNFIFAEMANSTAEISAPSGSMLLFEVVTDGTSITTVNDYRSGGIVFLSDPLFADGASGRLKDAVSTIGSLSCLVIIDCDDNVLADTTVPSTMDLYFFPGNELIIASTKTLTINSPQNIHAGKRQKIKSGSGSIAFTNPGTVSAMWLCDNDGTSEDGPELKELVDALHSIGGGEVLLSAGDGYVIGTTWDGSVNTDVMLSFENNAIIKDNASNASFTWGGSIKAEKTQQIASWGNGTGHIVLSKKQDLTPDNFGGFPVATSLIAMNDCTNAINQVIATGSNLIFNKGCYGTTGGHSITTDGVTIRGQKRNTAAGGEGGTTVKRISGTTTLFSIGHGAQSGMEDLILDGNSLGGILVETGFHYGFLRGVVFNKVGGTSYALHLDGVNVSDITVNFGDNCYGCMLIDDSLGRGYAALYSSIKMYHGSTTAYGLSIEGPAQNLMIDYGGDNTVPAIHFGGAVPAIYDVTFTRLSLESSNTTGPDIILDATSGNIQNVSINNVKIIQAIGDNASYPFIKIVGTNRLQMQSAHLTDDRSSAGRSLIEIDTAIYPIFRDLMVKITNNINLFEDVGSANTFFPTIENICKTGAGTLSCIFRTSNLYLSNFPYVDVTFIGTSTSAVFIRGGSVNTSNLTGSVIGINMNGTITDIGEKFTLLGNGNTYHFQPPVRTAITEPDIPTNSMLIWIDTGVSKKWIIVDIAGTQYKIELT